MSVHRFSDDLAREQQITPRAMHEVYPDYLELPDATEEKVLDLIRTGTYRKTYVRVKGNSPIDVVVWDENGLPIKIDWKFRLRKYPDFLLEYWHENKDGSFRCWGWMHNEPVIDHLHYAKMRGEQGGIDHLVAFDFPRLQQFYHKDLNSNPTRRMVVSDNGGYFTISRLFTYEELRPFIVFEYRPREAHDGDGGATSY